MLSQIEVRFYELGAKFFAKFINKEKEIDWEQRRYEIAKERYCSANFPSAVDAVKSADLLIEELKKTK